MALGIRAYYAHCLLVLPFLTAGLAAQDPDYVLDLTDATGSVDDTATIAVTLTSSADDVVAYQFDVCDDALIETGFGDVALGDALDSVDFSTHSVSHEDDGWSVAAALESGSLSAGDSLELYLVTYELIREGLSEPYFCGRFLEPLVTTVGLDEIEPATGSGVIAISASLAFLRGDVSADGRVEALFDARFLMDFLFAGTTTAPCYDAADVNNDGTINISDAVWLLGWGLAGGAPPEAPGPDECGIDPEGGDLGCASPPVPCPGEPLVLYPYPAFLLTVEEAATPVEVDENTRLSVTLAIDGDPVQGYQFGVCHDPGVALADLSPLDSAVTVGVDPADTWFDVVSIYDDGWTAGALWSEPFGGELAAGEYALYLAAYTVLLEGPSTVTICDSVGDPTVPPRILRAGEFLLPSTTPGGVTGIPDLLDFELRLGTESGGAGGTAEVTVSITNDGDPIEGWHWGVCHDDLVALASGAVADGAALLGLEFEIHTLFVEPGGWTVSALLDSLGGDLLAPGTDLEMYTATYTLIGTLFGSNISRLEFCETLGDPAVPIGWTVNGEEFVPEIFNGGIVIGPPTPFTFSVNSAPVPYDPDDVPPELTFSVELTIQENSAYFGFPSDTDGFSMGIAHDGSLLEAIEASPVGVLAAVNGGSGPDFLSIDLDPAGSGGDGVTVASVYSLSGGVSIVFREREPVIEVEYAILDVAVLRGNVRGIETSLEWSETLGEPPVATTVSSDGMSINVALDDGTVALTPIGGAQRFLRGDSNGSGDVSALVDALHLLTWTFLEGDPPPCLDAADVDDSGVVSALLDALYLLEWQFLSGEDPPPPGPFECGIDPDGGTDGIGCESGPMVCS